MPWFLFQIIYSEYFYDCRLHRLHRRILFIGTAEEQKIAKLLYNYKWKNWGDENASY